jgi:hypothetical protein
MPQIFNLNGTPIQLVSELRVDVVKDQSASIDIVTVNNNDQSVSLHNIKKIFTKNGREINANNIVEM